MGNSQTVLTFSAPSALLTGSKRYVFVLKKMQFYSHSITQERNCPICRKASRFILPWHGLIASKEEKAKIAEMQAIMVKASEANDNSVEPDCSTGLAQALAIMGTVVLSSTTSSPPQEQLQVDNAPGSPQCDNNGRENNNRGRSNRGFRGNNRGGFRGGNNRGGFYRAHGNSF